MGYEVTNMHYRRTARILTVACGLLFSTFSFLYLYVFQKDLLEAFHYSLSEGKTQFSPLGTALSVTIVLLILRWGVNAMLHLKGAVRELAYFPSCLLLGILTSVRYSVYQGEALADYWIWLLPLSLLIFMGVAYVVGRFWDAYFGRSVNMGWIINGNLFILLMLCLMTVVISNTQIHFHQELAIEAALKENNYKEAREVGKKMTDPSQAMTALRSYALSKEGTMGEYLFDYPQLYGSEGLLLNKEDADCFRLTADSLYTYLGSKPMDGERAIDFLGRICREDVGSHVALDYYLSALLLDRRLDQFVSEWETLYLATDSILPRYYEEALFLYDKMHPTLSPKVNHATLEEKWKAYEEMQQELHGKVGESNWMRREYGNTYWCYYQYH